MKESERNKLILAVIILAVMTPISFIGGMAFGGAIQTDFILTADSLSSWVSAIATVSIAILTFILAKETWYLRAAQNRQLEQLQRDAIRPSVDFSFVPSKVSIHFLELEIKNTGKGIAQGVHFKILPSEAGEKPFDNEIVKKLETLGAIKHGISSLGINQRYASFLFNFLEVMQKMGREATFSTKFLVEISFADANGYNYKNIVTIDLSQYIGVIEVGGGNPSYKISKDIERLANWAEGLTRGNSKRFNINSYTATDREIEKKEHEEWLQQAKEDRENPQTECHRTAEGD